MFGAGLLVGTALAVIIPEGVRPLLTETTQAHNESATAEHTDPFSVIGLSLVLGFVFMLCIDQVNLYR